VEDKFSQEDDSQMEKHSRLAGWLLVGTLALSFVGMGCAHHHYYRVYDPYYNDYHVWNGPEVDYYHQWADEYHRDPNRDFRKLPPGEQKEYWTWRHSHGQPAH
jgi:hypothetical protein